VVVATAAVLLVTVVSLLLAGVAQATNHGPSARAARQDLVQVVVHPGQSLWSVAESADPGQDTPRRHPADHRPQFAEWATPCSPASSCGSRAAEPIP